MGIAPGCATIPTWAIMLSMAEKRSIGSQMVAKRFAKMTPEERSAAAKNAAVKRWATVKKKTAKAKRKAKG